MSPRTFAYSLAHRLRLIWWRLARPDVHGAKAVIINGRDEVLLVRHAYAMQHLYMLPGGGFRPPEDPAAAAEREVREETGVAVSGAMRLHGVFVDQTHGARNHIHVFVGDAADNAMPRADGTEIAEAGWFPLNALPANLSASSGRRIIEVRDGLPAPLPDWRPQDAAD